MSDRCYLEITLKSAHLADLHDVTEIEFDDLECVRDSGEGYVTATCYDADAGWYFPLHDLAARGVPFFGANGPGDEYGPSEFCGVDGSFFDAMAAHGVDGIVVPIDEHTGEPSRADLDAARTFLEARSRARAAVLS